MRKHTADSDGRKAGFTLIELLVVIAIIAILASILFPVFARGGTSSASRATQIYRCPSVSFSAEYAATNQVFAWAGNAGTTPVTRVASVQAPALVYMVMDGSTYVMPLGNVLAPSSNYFIPGSKKMVPASYQNVITSVDRDDDFESGRHFNGLTILYADGHAKWQRSEEPIAEARHSAAGRLSAWNINYEGTR